MEERDEDPGAAGADRVAQGNGAAEDVHLLRIQLQLAHDGEALGGEGLVELEDVDVLDLHAGAGQHLGAGLDRAHTHDLGGEDGYR